jgi:phospholipase A1
LSVLVDPADSLFFLRTPMPNPSLAAAAALLLFLSPGPARGEVLVIAPVEPVVAGSAITLDLYFKNESEETRIVSPPKVITARLSVERTSSPLELKAEEASDVSPLRLAPRSFVRIAYTATLPLSLEGLVKLSLEGVTANPVLLAVRPAPEPPPVAAAASDVPREAEPSPPQPAPFALISPYEPLYFIYGTRGGESAKFQLSFKYRFVRPDRDLARLLPGIEDIYLGYAQTSLWDLERESKPFRDTSYKPRFFYFEENLWRSAGDRLRVGLETGYGHESNGRDGDQSRSIDILYARPIFALGNRQDYHLVAAPGVWVYLDKEENPDIDEFRGYADLYLALQKTDSWQLATTLRLGSDGDKGSVQVDLSYPLTRIGFGNIDGYLLAQYFNGYGESLLDYNRKLRSQFRFGVMLLR